MTIGRPRSITQQVEQEIFARIISGRTVYNIGRNDDDMPTLQTIYAELHRNERFAEGLARAREIGAFALAESTVELADEAVEALDPTRAQLLINQCRLRQWLAGRYNKAFADKQEVVHRGQVDHVHSLAAPTDVLTEVFPARPLIDVTPTGTAVATRARRRARKDNSDGGK